MKKDLISRLIIFSVALLMLSSPAYSARVTSPWFKIVQLAGYSNTAGGLVTADQNIDQVCNTSPGYPGAGFRYQSGQAGTTIDGVKFGMSVLLSAFVAGKEVQVDYEDSSSSCHIYLVRIR